MVVAVMVLWIATPASCVVQVLGDAPQATPRQLRPRIQGRHGGAPARQLRPWPKFPRLLDPPWLQLLAELHSGRPANRNEEPLGSTRALGVQTLHAVALSRRSGAPAADGGPQHSTAGPAAGSASDVVALASPSVLVHCQRFDRQVGMCRQSARRHNVCIGAGLVKGTRHFGPSGVGGREGGSSWEIAH